VDRSIDDPAPFVRTNVFGTLALLEEVRTWWDGLPEAEKGAFRFLHVGTDEVFGSLGASGAFSEASPHAPRSPYSASKAAADHLVRAWHVTYGLPTLQTWSGNNYGPWQYPEKLIPLVVGKGLRGEPLPVYGDGLHVRPWIHVEDHVAALLTVLERAAPGSTYVVGDGRERTNLDVVRALCAALDAERPRHAPHARLVTHVPDRPGHDRRYALDGSRLAKDLGWRARHDLDAGLRETVRWILAHEGWYERIRTGAYRGERLGLGAAR
jgi:dTDP-glucose 4,6-dehydratase